MVADDKVDSFGLGIGDLFRRFDPAVERDDQPHALALRVVDRFDRNAVAFGVAVGNVEQQRRESQPAQERIDQRDGGRSVYVVIAVDHDRLVSFDGFVDPFDGAVHILHQERIVQVLQFRVKELPCFLFGFDATLNK